MACVHKLCMSGEIRRPLPPLARRAAEISLEPLREARNRPHADLMRDLGDRYVGALHQDARRMLHARLRKIGGGDLAELFM